MPFYDAPSRRTPHDVPKGIRFAFWTAWAVIYLFLPTRLYNGEVLNLLWRLDHAPWWESFHPQAFIWSPMLQFGLHLARSLGFDRYPGQELQFLQTLNGCFALLLLASIYRWSRLLGARTSVAFTVTGFVGANFTCWHWGTDVNPYVAMTLFGTWAVWCAWSYATYWHKDRLYWSAVFLGLAMWVHLLSSVLLLPIAYAILSRQEHPLKRKLLAWGAHSLIVLLLVGIPYLAVAEGLYRGRPNGGLVRFVASGLTSPTSWGDQTRGDERKPWIYSVALGHFNLAMWADHDLLYYTYRRPPDEQALFDNPILGQVVPFLWLLNTVLAVIALFPTVSLLRQGEPGRNLALLLLWTTSSFLLIGGINPAFGYLRLIYLPAMALLVGLWITLSPQTRKRPIQALVVLMFAWNFFMGIWPNSIWGHVPEYKQALEFKGLLGPQDVVILPAKHDYLSRHLRTFTRCERMLVGGAPRQVFPPPGITEAQFSLLDGTTMILGSIFQEIYLEQSLDNQLTADEELRFMVTRPPGDIPVEMILIRQVWSDVRTLQGRQYRITLREIGPKAADWEPYALGSE